MVKNNLVYLQNISGGFLSSPVGLQLVHSQHLLFSIPPPPQDLKGSLKETLNSLVQLDSLVPFLVFESFEQPTTTT